MLKIIIKKPNEKPEVKKIPNELKSLQNIVGGYIETVKLWDNYLLVCNEEGLLQQLKPNINLPGVGIIVGTIFITKHNGKGEFISLNDGEIQDIVNKLF